jgi:hypothetical protein
MSLNLYTVEPQFPENIPLMTPPQEDFCFLTNINIKYLVMLFLLPTFTIIKHL